MLETISEAKALKAPLPPRASKLFSTDLTTQKPGIYGDDQDPSFSSEKDLEYAKSYGRQLQTLSVKDTGSAPTTAAQPGNGERGIPSDSPSSDMSDQSFVQEAQYTFVHEPLYGDPDEEDFWK